MDQYGYGNEQRGGFPYFRVGIPIVGFLLILVLIFASHTTIDGSQGGVLVFQGKPTSQLSAGFNWKYPVVSNISLMTIRKIQMEAVSHEKGETMEQAIARSGSEIKQQADVAKARGGQLIDQAPFRLWFHIPPTLFEVDESCKTVIDDDGNPVVARQDNLIWIYNNIGRSEQVIHDSVVFGPARQAVRDVLLQFEPEALIGFIDPSDPDGDSILQFGDINGEINKRVIRELCVEMHAQGVVLDDFAIGKLDFNDTFEGKIAETQSAAQQVEIERNNVLAAEQRALSAEKEAEGRAQSAIAEAEGRAESNKLEAAGRAEATEIEADANAHQIEVEGAAQAEANRLQVEALGGPDGYVRAKMAEALGSWRPTNLLGGESGIVPFLNLDEGSEAPPVP